MTLLLVVQNEHLQMRRIPIPLSNAGSTSIGEYNSTNITQDLGLEEGQHEFEETVSCIFQRLIYTVNKKQPRTNTMGYSLDLTLCYVRLTYPSLSMVARICSEPGVTVNWALHFRPLSRACLAREAALPMSS